MCGQWVFTLFLWSPRFGQIAQCSDEKKIKYYTETIKSREADDMFPPNFEIPHIGGSFNDWNWTKMQSTLDYCMNFDPSPPDFLKDLISKKYLPVSVGAPDFQAMTAAQEKELLDYKRAYYKERWPKLLL